MSADVISGGAWKSTSPPPKLRVDSLDATHAGLDGLVSTPKSDFRVPPHRLLFLARACWSPTTAPAPPVGGDLRDRNHRRAEALNATAAACAEAAVC